jgi:hypothetical protein
MSIPPKKTVVIVAGPTAVGKTSVAVTLAKHFQTEIISADSRQCFKELKIGVARPSEKELSEIKHHFIASHSVRDVITAKEFEKFALKKVTGLFEKHDIVIIVGGTGLYIKTFCEGLDEIPAIDPGIRQKILKDYKEKGIEFEFGDVTRLVVGRVHVVHARLQARIHDRQVLIGKRHVDDEVGLHLLDERHDFGNLVGIDLADLDGRLAARGDLLAALEAPRRQVDLLEHVAVHGALLRNDGTRGTRTDDQDVVQSSVLRCWSHTGNRAGY